MGWGTPIVFSQRLVQFGNGEVLVGEAYARAHQSCLRLRLATRLIEAITDMVTALAFQNSRTDAHHSIGRRNVSETGSIS